ncbi:MAG: 16S rRNA (adenine(1518)-N(6)/adenine(1519)-N(6))-dimethyltransferase RsmA [Chlamydiales bacterium]
MTLSELLLFLKEVDAKPRKSLSQNFLIDPGMVRKIVDSAEIAPGDAVLEIGPGPGALTAPLLASGARVFAVETDPLFAGALSRFQNGRLKIAQTDFLKFPMDVLPKKIKVVANLPYHITTPILEKLFASSFSSLTIMVQKEVADRMISPPGSKTFGSLSLFVQFHSDFVHSFTVPPAAFYPQPKVDSTVIRLNAKERPAIDSIRFFSLVHTAFQQRRKMITSSLPFPKESIRRALSELDVRPDARPETLSLDQWIQLARNMQAV